jgi:hypothetical protein
METAPMITALALAMTTLAADPANTWRYTPENDAVGRIYYYERTNSDGTMDERVTVFRRDATHIEVYKENGLCRGAALVTAELDFETFSAPVITGGQLLPDALHREFAFLEWDQAANQLNILVQLPDMELREEAPTPRADWHLFDFDLASLTVMTPHLADPSARFEFGMALVWTDPSAGDPLTWMGDVEANPAGRETHLGQDSHVYALTGSAFDRENATGTEGRIWLDANDGHVVDAVFPAPNHPGYTDFRLRLLEIGDGGATEWEQLLRAHYDGCE